MICAGTIFGTAEKIHRFLIIYTQELKKKQCNDQGTLNVLFYTGVVKTRLFKHEDGVVLSMNKAETYDISSASVIHTGDNPLAIKAVNTLKKYYQKITLFRNVLSKTEDKLSYDFLYKITHMLDNNDVPVILDGGLLIGAALHGARIPWDDDMDIYIQEKYKKRALVLLQKELSFSTLNLPLYSKVYNNTAEKISNNRDWNWPFIDIGWLQENSTHLWETRTAEKKYSNHVYSKDTIFPLQKIKLDALELQAPRDINAFFRVRYGEHWAERCVYANWDHKHERIRHPSLGDGDFTYSVKCTHIPWITYSPVL